MCLFASRACPNPRGEGEACVTLTSGQGKAVRRAPGFKLPSGSPYLDGGDVDAADAADAANLGNEQLLKYSPGGTEGQ